MNCEDFELYGSAYLDNMLSKEELVAFENHMNECEYCNIKLENLKIIVETINDIEEVELPINFSNELKLKLKNEKANNTKKTILNNKKLLSAIAAGIFIIITSVSLMNNSLIYKNGDNLASEIDEMSRNQEEVTFDIASEKSTESLEEIENEKTAQPRIMAIDNTDKNHESAAEDSIEETNEETYNIMTKQSNESSLESKEFENEPYKNNENKKLNISILALIVAAAGILMHKRIKS